jgi:excisionase family DNA binding protein
MSDKEQPATSPFETTEGVAQYFNVSVWTVRDWVKRGIIPSSAYIKVAKTTRFKLDQVEAALVSVMSQDETETEADDEPVTVEPIYLN